MPTKLVLRAGLVALLLLLCLVAGLIGGMDFPPDVALIRHFEDVRATAPGLTISAIAVTQIGSAYGTISSGVAATAWLGWRGDRWRAWVLGVTVAAERLIVDGMKLLIDRSRPAFDLHPVATHSSSFPSGHAGNSMAVLLSIALIAAPRPLRLPAVVAAILASMTIGVTRPYLGVHWPSDVIGGWALGAAIALVAASIAEARRSLPAQQQHQIIGGH
jgi:undecaprenyl-diphosphatase